MISAVFGQEQSTLAVVLFCMLMSIRFVDFGYRVKQGIIGLGLVLFTTYRNQTILNCFGALLLAQDRYGIGGSVQLRIWINVIGLLFVGIFLLSLIVLSLLYNQLKRRKLRQNNC